MLKKILIPLMLLLLIAPQASAAKKTISGYLDKKGIVEKDLDMQGYYVEKIDIKKGRGIGYVVTFSDGKKYFSDSSTGESLKYINQKVTWTSVRFGNTDIYLNTYYHIDIYYAKLLDALSWQVLDSTHNTVDIKIDKSTAEGAKQYIIFVDGKEHQRLTSINDVHTIKNLQPQKTYNINVVYNDGESQSDDNIQTANTKDPPPPPKLQQDHVRAQNITDKSAELYVAALIPNYDHIYIYDKDDKLIHQQPIAGMVAYRHQLKDLQQDTSYKYFVQVKHGSVLSDKLQIAFKTPITETEVANLQGRNEGESVVLSWINPTYNDFKWVKIYRKKEDEPAPKAKFFGFGMMTASAAAGYNPMFKFDGQNWQDLTVEAATTYEYKVTTLDAKSNETDGKTVKVKTLPPKIGGSELTGGEDKKKPDGTPELDADGNPIKEDFVIKWSTPTKGKVKVMVGGQEYTTVQASQQQVTIPYNEMKYDGLGNPQVQLIPIADNGTTGQTAQPPPPSGGTIGNVVGSGASAAVNANNLLQISLGLLAKVALFILLGMAFMLVPKLVRIIYYAVTGKDSYGMEEENKKIRVIEKRR